MNSSEQESGDDSIWMSSEESQALLNEYQEFLDDYQQQLHQQLAQKTGETNIHAISEKLMEENSKWIGKLSLCDPEIVQEFINKREAKEKEERLRHVSPETRELILEIERQSDILTEFNEEREEPQDERSLEEKEFIRIEDSLVWLKNLDRFNPIDRLLFALKHKIRKRSLSENLLSSIYETRLKKVLEFISELHSAYNHRSNNKPDSKKNEQVIWSHRPDNEVSGVDKENEPKINRATLLQAAATYLANPWLQDDQIDWIFLDSLIYAELAGYRGLIFSGQALGKIHWAYMFSGGDIQKMAKYSIIIALTRFALRYLVPPLLIIALYALQFETAFQVFGVAYVAYLVLRAALWPLRRRKEKLKDKAYKEHEDRLKKIMVAYWHCSPPVISLATLRTSLDEAIESGANFDGALFSILKRVETTRGESFMPFTESI